jgi:hypothetical protein
MKKFNIITFEEDTEFESEYATDFLKLEDENHDFGIQMVSWSQDMIGLAKDATRDIAKHMLTK